MASRVNACCAATFAAATEPWKGQFCDTIANPSETALDRMSDAVAHATLLYAMTRSSVNGTDKTSSKAKENMGFRGLLLNK